MNNLFKVAHRFMLTELVSSFMYKHEGNIGNIFPMDLERVSKIYSKLTSFNKRQDLVYMDCSPNIASLKQFKVIIL